MFRRTDAAHLRDRAIGRDPRDRDPTKKDARIIGINAFTVTITIVSDFMLGFLSSRPLLLVPILLSLFSSPSIYLESTLADLVQAS